MKKHILAIILCVLCASLVFVLASCGDTNTNTDSGSGECTEHSFGDWTTETYASCTSAGLKVRVCTKCSFEEEEEIPAGHKFGEWETVTELSCEQNGVMQRICSACDFVEEDTTEATGHAWGDWAVTTPGDCTNKGEETRVCDNCGADETREIAAEGHSWSEWGFDIVGESLEKEATCMESGYTGRECFNCGERDMKYFSLGDHDWSAWNLEGINCETGGTKTRACNLCGKEEAVEVVAGEHLDVVVTGQTIPTATTPGSTGVTKCQACNKMIKPSFPLPALSNLANVENMNVTMGDPWWAFIDTASYLFDGNVETTSNGVRGGKQFIMEFDLDSRSFVSEIVIAINGKGTVYNKWGSSEVADYAYNNTAATITCYKNGVVVKTETFDTSALTEITLSDINASVDKIELNVTTKELYGGAYIWEITALGSVPVTPCDTAGEHSWENWVTKKEAVCSKTELINGLEKRTCSACYEVEEREIIAEHSFGDWNFVGNCTEGGVKTRVCSSCSFEESQAVSPGDHMNVVLEGKADPTFEADGSTGAKVCKVCNTIVEPAKKITKLENIASQSTVTTTSGCWTVKDYLPALTDGNREMGTAGSHNEAKYDLVLDFGSNKDVDKVIIVVNSKGQTYTGANGPNIYNEVTNFGYEITVNITDANGNSVYSQKYNTKDMTEIVIEPTSDISKITLTVQSNWDNGIAVWEVETITGGDIVE